MRILIVSDIHGNFPALKVLPERDYDALWCIGDLVNYGPFPHEVTAWTARRATVAVRGNHDHAVGLAVDPRCSPPYRRLAEHTMRYSMHVCTGADFDYLRSLPLNRELSIEGTTFYLVHAMPSDPLFGYCRADSDQWREQAATVNTNVLIVGHTHRPFVRKEGRTTIVNPGSLGQPKTGRPQACYAVWQDGKIELKEYSYPIEETIRGIRQMDLPHDVQDALIAVLQTGEVPPGRA